MPADFGAVTCTAKSLTGSDLFLKWKEITHDLVARGHAAELYQELDNRTHRGNPVGAHVPKSTCSQREDPPHGSLLAEKLKFNTNDAEIHDVFANIDDTSSISSSEESESDHDIYDEMVIPSHLVDEATELPQYYSANSLFSFEQIFAQERLVTPGNSGHYEVEDVPDHLNSDPNMLSSTPLFRLTFPPSASAQNQFLPSSPSEFPERDLSGGEQRNRFDKEIEPMASQLTSSTQRRKSSRKATGLRVSDKRNLTPTAILVVADLLVSPDTISYFLSHCRAIYESWMPSTSDSLDSLDHSRSIETRVVAALDRVQDLLNGYRVCRLLLRFAYLQLAWSINAYKDVAAADRVQRRVRRKVGHRDATVAITLYLQTKQKVSARK
jgi:hypothetical protein